MQWLDLTLPGIAANLALDEALLIEADERGGGPALRLWEPAETAVVLGASCRWRDDVRARRAVATGWPSRGGRAAEGPWSSGPAR